MTRNIRRTAALAALLAASASFPALAVDNALVERIDSGTVTITWANAAKVDVFVSADTQWDEGDTLALAKAKGGKAQIPLASDRRLFVILRDADNGRQAVVAERELPLEKGSNFRDLGGYRTKDGHKVRWGKVFRSGALPMLTERDYGLLETLNIGSIVDLRSVEERTVAPTMLDDRTGALFLSNDYSLKPLFASFGQGDGENMYRGMQTLLRPQIRAVVNRILADEGAVMFHCSAGQDRTGVTAALIYEVLGIPRETILADYHLSTALRRPQNEMPALDPADHPGNPIVAYYAKAAAKEGGIKAEPLYTPSGQSHMVQFLAWVDETHGGVSGYLERELGITLAEQDALRAALLEPAT